MKRTLLSILLFSLLSSCSWFRQKPEIALILAKHFDNKLYKQFDTAGYRPLFKQKLADLRKELAHPKVTTAFYLHQEDSPILVARFFVDGSLDSLANFLSRSRDDGFDPQVFKLDEIRRLLQTLKSNRFKQITEVYPVIAELELRSADALLRYGTFMKYGCVNPRKIYNRYYINLKRPDSMKLDSMLNSHDLVGVLRSSQQASPTYIALKRQLSHYRDSLKNERHPAIRTIKINMERMRWQLPVQTDETVWVNIPDFSLTWLRRQDTLAHMNVCVGAKREETYPEKMKLFLKSGKLDDKPKNHETPQLASMFNAIQVNPIWNIPVSIAQSEIYYQALRDPYYLSNSNIKVYFRGKLVTDPDTIQWSRYRREKLPFTFKQGSGGGNALGKFKFIFESSSSIYLHDTNYKIGFRLANRAISHGCVRIENPLKFAELLVRDKYQYDQLRMEVDLPPLDTASTRYKKYLSRKADTLRTFRLKPSWFATRKQIAVVITYYTAWAEQGRVEFRPDVYQYDDILWDSLKKYQL